MKIRKICKYEFEGVHDVEFVPSEDNPRCLQVWVDGVYIETMREGEKASVARAWYYYEVHGKAPEADEDSVPSLEDSLVEVPLHAH